MIIPSRLSFLRPLFALISFFYVSQANNAGRNVYVCSTYELTCPLSVLTGELQIWILNNLYPERCLPIIYICRFGHSLVTSIVNKLEAKPFGNPLNTTTFKLEDNFFMIE